MRRLFLALVFLAGARSALAETPPLPAPTPAQILEIPYVEDPARGLATLQTRHLELLLQLIQAQAEAIRRRPAQPPVTGECI